MAFQGTEAIILNDDEFLVMLAAVGRRSWYGIELSGADLSRDGGEAINVVLSSLYQKSLIDWGEHGARISDEQRPLFQVLRNAASCVLYAGAGDPGNVRGCYVSDGTAALVERSRYSSRELKLTLMPADEWIGRLCADGYVPDVIQTPDRLVPDRRYSMDDDRQIRDFFMDENVASVFEKRLVPSGELEGRLVICDTGLFGTAHVMSRGSEKAEICDEDLFRTVLGSWTEGGKQ